MNGPRRSSLPSREQVLAVTWLHLLLFQKAPTQSYVAARLQFEPRELRRRWRARECESVRLLIAEARLLYAASMVREEECKATAAIRCAGYASHASANRVCRKLTGHTIATCRECDPVSFDRASFWAAVDELRPAILAAGPASGSSTNRSVGLLSVAAGLASKAEADETIASGARAQGWRSRAQGSTRDARPSACRTPGRCRR